MLTRLLCNALMVILMLMSTYARAQGDLLITPKRLVFDGSKRAEEINLANIGRDTATYAISFKQFRMDENGNFLEVSETDSTQKFAHKNLRFFPRTVTLAPNEAQSVKVQLIRASELSPGEYRSHLVFKNVSNKVALGEEEKEAKKDSGLSVNIKPVFGISIATIIRMGDTNVEAQLTETRFVAASQAAGPSVRFTILRTGNISLYGDLQVTYIEPNKKPIQVAIMKGLAVYTPNTSRNVHLSLKSSTDVNYSTGKLQIEYINNAIKNSLLCNAEIVF